MKIEQSASEL